MREESMTERSKGQSLTLLGEKNEWFQVTREGKWRDGTRKHKREGEGQIAPWGSSKGSASDLCFGIINLVTVETKK